MVVSQCLACRRSAEVIQYAAYGVYQMISAMTQATTLWTPTDADKMARCIFSLLKPGSQCLSQIYSTSVWTGFDDSNFSGVSSLDRYHKDEKIPSAYLRG